MATSGSTAGERLPRGPIGRPWRLLTVAVSVLGAFGCQLGYAPPAEPPPPEAHVVESLSWVAMPAGSFRMGRDDGPPEQGPAHVVAMGAFWVTRSEVTVAQYRSCVEAGACGTRGVKGYRDGEKFGWWSRQCNWTYPDRPNHPMNCLDWIQAQAFCVYVGGRLPTEAEWEYAARSGGGQTRRWPWADDAPPTCERAWMRDDRGPGCGTGSTAPVCTVEAGRTPAGVCDMAGNVAEWTADWYDPDIYTARRDAQQPALDPVGPRPGSTRAVRGGSARSVPKYVETTNRWHKRPGDSGGSVGFRCATRRPPMGDAAE